MLPDSNIKNTNEQKTTNQRVASLSPNKRSPTIKLIFTHLKSELKQCYDDIPEGTCPWVTLMLFLIIYIFIVNHFFSYNITTEMETHEIDYVTNNYYESCAHNNVTDLVQCYKYVKYYDFGLTIFTVLTSVSAFGMELFLLSVCMDKEIYGNYFNVTTYTIFFIARMMVEYYASEFMSCTDGNFKLFFPNSIPRIDYVKITICDDKNIRIDSMIIEASFKHMIVLMIGIVLVCVTFSFVYLLIYSIYWLGQWITQRTIKSIKRFEELQQKIEV